MKLFKTGLALLCVFTFVFTGSSFAQSKTVVLGKGFKGGINFAEFGGSDAEQDGLDPGARNGLRIGGFVTLGWGSALALQPELYYSQKGSKYEQGGEKVVFKFDYLELPVLLKYLVPTSSKVTPSLFAGPAVAVKLSSDILAEADGQSAQVGFGNVNAVDFSMVFGVGLDVPAKEAKITFDIRYDLGLSGLAGSEESSEILAFEDNVDVKNRAFSFLVGYSF